MKRKTLLLGGLAALILPNAACGAIRSDSGSGSGSNTENVTFGAATQGGFWYVLAGALGDKMENELGSSVSIIEGGSISNITGLANGEFQVGLANGQNVPEALEGFGGFEEPVEGISGVASLYPNVMQIVVRKDSDIQSVEDLEGKRVSPGIKGYGGEIAFQQILELNGLSYDDMAQVEYIGTDDGANQMRDGQLEALAIMLNTPNSTIQELDSSVGARLIPLSGETISGLRESNPGYLDHTIPADAYGTEEDIRTTAAYTTLLVSDDLPEDYVREFTGLLVENRDEWADLSTAMSEFDAEYSVSHLPEGLDLHPGAQSYYEEAGVL